MARATRLTQDLLDEFLTQGWWDSQSIADILEQNAEKYPEREAVIDSRRRFTWSALNRMVDRVALGLLKAGIQRDQFLIAQLPSSTTTVILLLACHKAGIICCFPPMTFRQKEMHYLLQTLGAVAVLTPFQHKHINYFHMVREAAGDLPHVRLYFTTDEEASEGAIAFRQLAATSLRGERPEVTLKGTAFGPFEVSSIVLSSGTTGMPKCIEHTGASSKAGGKGVALRGKLTPDDVMGNVAPLSGGPGLQNWWACLHLGAKMCLLEHSTPEGVLDLIQREKVTYLSVIPTQLIRILKECDLNRYDLSSLRIVRTGAAAFDASLARETEEKLQCKVLIAGGSQETYSFAQSGVDDPKEKRLTTLGKPFPGNEIKICDDDGNFLPQGQIGHLSVRGASTSSGYYGDPDGTLAAWGTFGRGGWYKTGDLARVDEEGYLILAGRVKDMIIRGGQNIYPREIEDLLLSHPNVMQAVLLGIPDPVMGERACACVTLREGGVFSFDDMTAFLRNKGLAVHKLPEKLEVYKTFPELVDGQKVDKMALKKQISKKMGAKIP